MSAKLIFTAVNVNLELILHYLEYPEISYFVVVFLFIKIDVLNLAHIKCIETYPVCMAHWVHYLSALSALHYVENSTQIYFYIAP